MSDRTGIAWTDATWNPLRGCSRVSEGCRHCYAEAVASRFSGEGMPYHGLARDGRWTGVVRLVPEKLEQPLRWKRPRRIFVNSMSDLFHEKVPDKTIAAIFGVMAAAPQHTFQVLTKRPARMCRALEWMSSLGHGPEGKAHARGVRDWGAAGERPWPLPNVHLGVSVEDQPTADERILDLLATPAAVRFVSYEPALGPVDFDHFVPEPGWWCDRCQSVKSPVQVTFGETCTRCSSPVEWRSALDWIIGGGESGPGARPCDVAWIRSTVEQCRDAGVPCFIKQLGSNSIVRSDEDWSDESYRAVEAANDDVRSYPFRLSYRDRAGADPAEWPEDLRVREFPR